MLPRFLTASVSVFAACIIIMASGCSKNASGDDEVDDGVAPAMVADLMIAGFTDSSVTLTWTATGDDGTTGTATGYDLRMSSTAIHWGNYDSALHITGLPAPKPAGETEIFEVRGLMTDSTYFFILRVFDENGNDNGLSDCVSATCITDYVVAFPDPSLQTAIRNRIAKPSGDILKSDLLEVTDLFAADLAIADLTGLEHCDKLTALNLTNNDITDLSALSNLFGLTQLGAGQNSITDIGPLASLTALTALNLSFNNVVDISPLSNLTLLTDLNLQSNAVTDIAALAGLNQLNSLNITVNGIHDISPLVANTGIGGGDVVALSLNPLGHESIVSHIPTLRSRGVSVQWVDNIVPPGAVTDLTADSVTANSVTLSWTASGEDFYTGIAYRYELRYSTERTDLETWSGGSAVANMPDPDSAGARQSVVVSALSEGTTYYFALKTQDNSENWSPVSNIPWAQPYADIVVSFPDVALETAIRTAIAKPVGDIYRSELVSIDSLTAANQGISDLNGLEHCLGLEYLHLNNNTITDISPLSGLNSLWNLNVQHNSIADISPLSSLVALTQLQLSDNPITDLSPLASLSNVHLLAASFIGTADMTPLESLGQLEFAFLMGNHTVDLSPLASCTRLQYLYLGYNEIVDIAPLGGLQNLVILSLVNNQVEDIGVLVGNYGLGNGDQVAIENNHLSQESINTHIPALQARGVTVTF